MFHRDAWNIACHLCHLLSRRTNRARDATTRFVIVERETRLCFAIFFHFFSHPFFFFRLSLTFQHSSVISRAQVKLSRNQTLWEMHACIIFRCRREKLVANTNYYLSRGIQAAASLIAANKLSCDSFLVWHSSVCSGYNRGVRKPLLWPMIRSSLHLVK